MYIYYTHIPAISLFRFRSMPWSEACQRLGSGTFGSSTDLAGMVQSGSEENLKKLREAGFWFFFLVWFLVHWEATAFLFGKAPFSGGGYVSSREGNGVITNSSSISVRKYSIWGLQWDPLAPCFDLWEDLGIWARPQKPRLRNSWDPQMRKLVASLDLCDFW